MPTVECLGCGRTRQTEGRPGVSHSVCAQCYFSRRDLNSGLDWRNPTDKDAIIEDITDQLGVVWDGEPNKPFPQEAAEAYEELRRTIFGETEHNSGTSRK